MKRQGIEPVPYAERLRRAWVTRHARYSFEDEFWKHVDKSGGPDACWPGLGRHRFYRNVRQGGRIRTRHRVAWELTNGPIPEGLWVLHHCDNPPCCNPAHLFLGTNSDNQKDAYSKGRGGFQRHEVRRHRGDDHYARTQPWRLPRGERHGGAKLTAAQASDIRRRYQPIRGQMTALAREFGVHRTTIQHIVKGVIWREDIVSLVGPDEDPR